ncbi:hypothetical protein HYDPIDRAFT_154529 [Hydnomerulius pinastri MD-312]|uniref:Heterokaryon incompatibility domain-containing protein n=1 Tax=Hydnomerulius pinastri MD-312 TaxID=994086 RepID=A0A0C9W967_9AGAM|nr:hypothetical protein HYDPIDRAFT_154529 [Hydnomerulius pinastri MD-312]
MQDPHRAYTPLSGRPASDAPNLISRREQLQDALDDYVFNDLPTYLIRIRDKKLVTRDEIREAFRPQLEAISDEELRKFRSYKDYIRARLRYAIFSHRWGTGEPLHREIVSNPSWMELRGPGHLKLLKFCEKAEEHGCSYAWSDTCCIDKTSSAELEEAIRAMYRWYRDAEVCIVHLAESSTLDDFEREPWFGRGWTLQELLAPKKMRFYGRDWTPMRSSGSWDGDWNDKADWRILGAISKVTQIPTGELRNFRPACDRISQKMGWASKRKTTRIEDVAYSLIGIFDISMSISYGEGSWAFHRLVEVLAQRSGEPSFFAWAGESSRYSFALPSSPASYGGLGSQMTSNLRLTGSVFEEVGDRSYAMTKLGLQVKLLVLPVDWTHTGKNGYTLTPALLQTTPLITEAYYEVFQPSNCALGVVDFTRVEEGRGTLRTGERYFCLLLKRRMGSGWIKAYTQSVLTLRCNESITKQLETVVLLNS